MGDENQKDTIISCQSEQQRRFECVYGSVQLYMFVDGYLIWTDTC